MSTLQAIMTVYAWLMSDWTHPIVAMSVVAMVTPTPAPGTWLSKAYKIVDVLALNIMHAKSTGVPALLPADVAKQVAVLLEAKLSGTAATTPATQPAQKV
jgi:hypothetical protein